MTAKSANLIAESGLPLILKLPNGASCRQTGRIERVQTLVRSLTVFQKEAFVSSGATGEAWRMSSDEGKYLLGHDEAPAPLAFFTVGVVSSFMTELVALAHERNLPIKGLRLIVDNFYSMRGSMRDGTMVANAEGVTIEGKFAKAGSEADMLALLRDAVIASPVNGLMREPRDGLFSLRHNGKNISTGSGNSVRHLPLAEIGRKPRVPAGSADQDNILIRGSLSPRAGYSANMAGSSLANKQDRILHLRGICSLREDGVKVIEQHLFNPHGTAYTFLSDEAAVDGGRGLAPSAASYLSAGIGFCFMTQFGRFAKMQNSKLTGYSIRQDMGFSAGGASGGTGEPGDVTPPETHVFLESEEEDDFARHILAVSEQTCFLHAFCKAKIKPKLRVTFRNA